MEFRHDNDVHLHMTDVIRSFPIAATRTALRPVEVRDAVPGTEGLTAEPGRTITGYPIVFNQWTEIMSWDGPFLERIMPQAADRTLQKRSDKVQLMFNHGFDYALEQTPIGRHTVFTPDAVGVYNEGVLVDRGIYPKLDLVAELIRIGAIYGQSFRFRVEAETWRDKPEPGDHNPKGLPERDILEFALFESGPVTYPAYEATSVSLRDGIPSAVRSSNEFHLWCEARNLPASITEVLQVSDPSRYRSPARAALRARSDQLARLAG